MDEHCTLFLMFWPTNSLLDPLLILAPHARHRDQLWKFVRLDVIVAERMLVSPFLTGIVRWGLSQQMIALNGVPEHTSGNENKTMNAKWRERVCVCVVKI